MFFRQILHEEKSCLSYIIGCQSRQACAVIDPQGNPQEYIQTAQRHGMNITAVIDTHIHADHYSCAFELAEKTGASYYLGPNAETTFPHKTLQEGDILNVGNRVFRILHTPGHTPEHITLLVNNWFLLTGDTLFVSDVGRVDLTVNNNQTSTPTLINDLIAKNARELHASLKRLFEFPDWTEIYPGHFGGSVCGRGIDGKPISAIGRERIKNKPANLSRDDFVKFQLDNPLAPPKDFLTIKRKNEGK